MQTCVDVPTKANSRPTGASYIQKKKNATGNICRITLCAVL